jgi:hypothetical protein
MPDVMSASLSCTVINYMNLVILPTFSAAADLQLFHCAWWQLSGSPTPMVLAC